MATLAVGHAIGFFPRELLPSGSITLCRPPVPTNVARKHERPGDGLAPHAKFACGLSSSDSTLSTQDSRASMMRASIGIRVSTAAYGGGFCPRDPPMGMREAEFRSKRAATSITDAGDAGDDGFIRSKLAVFVSGGGSNFRTFHQASLNNLIYGDVVVVVSDRPDCKGCEYARENNLPILNFPVSKRFPDGLSAVDLISALRNYGIDYIILAGYLKLLPTELLRAYPRSVLNIHPSLLPAFGGKGFYGMKVHEAVIKSGARDVHSCQRRIWTLPGNWFSGATIHFVDETFDTGPILAQRIVPVLADDTPQGLAAKVLKVEHLLYTEALAALCEDRISWRDDGVPLIRKSWNEADYY